MKDKAEELKSNELDTDLRSENEILQNEVVIKEHQEQFDSVFLK